MQKDTVIEFGREPECRDALTEVIRQGARRLLAEALEAEVEGFLAEFQAERDRGRLVRNGYLPEREIQTGIGGVAVRVPRVRDREASKGEGLRFESKVVPRYLRRAKSVEELLPWLYLRGVSTGGFSDALEALLGPDAPGLSPATISRLKKVWADEHRDWGRRSLEGKKYVYFWVDGVYATARMDDAKLCLLVVIGATEDGKKELVAVEDGYRESEQSWMELLRNLKARGLKEPPKLATGDGALGFWKAQQQSLGGAWWIE